MRKKRAQKSSKREACLRIVNDKMIYLSSRGARGLGDRVDIYAWEKVVALVGSPQGEYHLSPKSEGCKGQNLCAKEAVAYLQEKYDIELGASLTVWRPTHEEETVAFVSKFITDEEAKCTFDGRFTRVELTYHKRYGEWLFVEDNCISFTQAVRANLAPRLSLYQSGDALVLLADKSGAYIPESRGERKGTAIYSNILAEYCKKFFDTKGRGMRLHAQLVESGVCFAAEEETLRSAQIISDLLKLDLGRPQNCFLCIRRSSIYLSARAAGQLGRQVELLVADGWLALRNAWKDGVKVSRTRYQNQIHAKWVVQQIVEYYPRSKKLYLQEHGDLLVMLYGPDEQPELPETMAFRPLTTEVTGGRLRQPEQHGGAVSNRL